MRGRKKKPIEIKKLEGNPGKRPLEDVVSAEDIKKVQEEQQITKPRWMTMRAKAIWDRLFPYLEKLGILTILDKESFAGFCQSYADWVEARLEAQKYKQDKSEYARRRYKECMKLADRAFEKWKTLAIEFGLTPSSRGRISIENKNLIKDKEWEEFEKLLTN